MHADPNHVVKWVPSHKVIIAARLTLENAEGEALVMGYDDIRKECNIYRQENPTFAVGGKVETEGGEDCGFDSNEEEIMTKVKDVSLVNGVFDCTFGGEGDDDFIIGEGVVVPSSSLVRSRKSSLGGMMVSLIFFEELEDEA
ncbi:hypothetical protein Tco_1275345 [Tanacetum coccineum]